MFLLSRIISPNAESNTINAVINLVESHGLKITKTSIRERLLGEPSYPSLLSITNALHSWKIETLSTIAKPEQIPDFPLPFLAQIQESSQNYFVVVREIKKGKYLISDAASTVWKWVEESDFFNKWTGITTLIDPENAIDEDFLRNTNRERTETYPIIAGLALFFGIIAIMTLRNFLSNGWNALPVTIYTVLHVIGVYIGFLLLWYEIDKNNPVLQKVCKIGKHTDCNAVLSSKGAKLPGGITWSEIGFSYFLGGILALILTEQSLTIFMLLTFISLFALPYVFFSIFYQWKIVKQWCVLCVSIQGLIIAEFVMLFLLRFPPVKSIILVPWTDYAVLLISFIMPLIFWRMIKPLIVAAKAESNTKGELLRLKNNKEIFDIQLQKGRKYDSEPQGLGIQLGNLSGTTKILKICSPYCNPCAKSHPILIRLLENNPDISLQIVFATTPDPKDKRNAPVKHFLAIAENGNEAMLLKALDEWYEAPIKDYSSFALKYPVADETLRQEDKITLMTNWCKEAGITGTPTIFVNGHMLPNMFSVTDFKFLFSPKV